jgi:type I restriction enzyme S subunit
MEKYDNYKDSGIEWIGEIPEHWEVKKIKHLTKLQGGYAFKSDLFSNEGTPIIRIGDISTNINFDECKKIDDDTIPKEYWLDQYDTLIALSGATTGKTCFVNNIPPKAFINQRVARIMFSNKLLYYIVNSGFFQEQILLTASGSAQENISNSQIENLEISISNTPEEQTAIAHYLDRKTAEIDELIADKKRLLELYEEEKTAIINQAVTKGINPDAPMKDSGIEWLGEIPEHWEVKRLKYVAKINPTKKAKYKDSDDLVTFLPMEKVGENGTYDCNIKKPISDLWNGFTYFEKGDILVAKITPCFENGKSALLNDLESQIGFGSTEFHVLRAENIQSNFLYYITRSSLFMELGEAFMTGAAGQKRVPTNFISEFELCLPNTIEEQQSIVHYIETETARIDSKKSKTEKLIELLTEYRTALISEVVTGKIKVIE